MLYWCDFISFCVISFLISWPFPGISENFLGFLTICRIKSVVLNSVQAISHHFTRCQFSFFGCFWAFLAYFIAFSSIPSIIPIVLNRFQPISCHFTQCHFQFLAIYSPLVFLTVSSVRSVVLIISFWTSMIVDSLNSTPFGYSRLAFIKPQLDFIRSEKKPNLRCYILVLRGSMHML